MCYADLSFLLRLQSAASLDNRSQQQQKGPASFTGEDVVELHAHGGTAVAKAVLDSLAALASYRPAEPGEFTKRYYGFPLFLVLF